MSSIRSRHGAARLGRAASLAAAAGLGLFALAGCSTLSMDSLSLDKLNPFREREEILPGTRVDAMTEADPLTVDADGRIFVADALSNTVRVYKSNGEADKLTFGEPGGA